MLAGGGEGRKRRKEGNGIRGRRERSNLQHADDSRNFVPWVHILAPTLQALCPLRKLLSFPAVAGPKPRRLADAGVQEPQYPLRAVIWG